MLSDVPVSSFIAGLLASPEPSVLATALQLAQLLMEKLPDIFRKCAPHTAGLMWLKVTDVRNATVLTCEDSGDSPVARRLALPRDGSYVDKSLQMGLSSACMF